MSAASPPQYDNEHEVNNLHIKYNHILQQLRSKQRVLFQMEIKVWLDVKTVPVTGANSSSDGSDGNSFKKRKN